MASFPVENPISGSPLIGSPIIVIVNPAAYHEAWVFHRVILRVYAGLAIPDASEGTSDADYTKFEFSTPVETKTVNGVTTTQPMSFDVSSALQAVADRYEYQSLPPTQYPYVKFRIEALDEYMENGDTRQTDVVPLGGLFEGVTPFYFYAVQGAFNDLERMLSDGNKQATYFTRKPTSSPEVVFRNNQVVIPLTVGGDGLGLESDYVDDGGHFVDNHPVGVPRSVVYTPAADGLQTLGDRQVYAIAKPLDGYLVRFINSMGCMETLHVRSLVTKEVNITTNKHAIARRETFSKFSRGLTVKQNDYETWALTSGPLDEQWASWYIHEFLMAERIWISVNPQSSAVSAQPLWVPFHVLPEETTVLRDQTKADMMRVEFKLQSDINGPLKC